MRYVPANWRRLIADDDIMMLLHTSILEWLLDVDNEHVAGVGYLANGTLERGNEGMFF